VTNPAQKTDSPIFLFFVTAQELTDLKSGKPLDRVTNFYFGKGSFGGICAPAYIALYPEVPEGVPVRRPEEVLSCDGKMINELRSSGFFILRPVSPDKMPPPLKNDGTWASLEPRWQHPGEQLQIATEKLLNPDFHAVIAGVRLLTSNDKSLWHRHHQLPPECVWKNETDEDRAFALRLQFNEGYGPDDPRTAWIITLKSSTMEHG
jgi:hypothetical protein